MYTILNVCPPLSSKSASSPFAWVASRPSLSACPVFNYGAACEASANFCVPVIYVILLICAQKKLLHKQYTLHATAF